MFRQDILYEKGKLGDTTNLVVGREIQRENFGVQQRNEINVELWCGVVFAKCNHFKLFSCNEMLIEQVQCLFLRVKNNTTYEEC